jgi:hypothetical protein
VPGIEEGNSCRFGIEICPNVFDPPVCVTNPLVIELESVPGNECDGLDNDCDGYIDEDYVPHTCFRIPDECPDSFVVRSTTICSEGAESCRPVFAGYDYCSPASAGDATCGALLGTACDLATLPCEPNAVCAPIAGTTGICGVNQSGVGCPQATPSCWFPAQVVTKAQCVAP